MTQTATFQTLLNHTHQFVLPNGLRVVFLQQGEAPVAALYLKIRAGGSDETPADTGIAHMLEHMLFKGTKIQGTLNYAREERYLKIIDRWAVKSDQARRKLESATRDSAPADQVAALKARVATWQRRLGLIQADVAKYRFSDEDSLIYSLNGERGYNAYTNRDLTSYCVELPANRIEVWARIESDRFKNPVFREFYTERDVVAEERRMRVDNVGSALLLERFLNDAYGSHPYARSLIGPMHQIQYFSLEQAQRFYREHYGPDNAVIAVVGRFDEKEVRSLIERYFGSWERRPHPATTPVPAPPLPRNLNVEVRHPGSPMFYMAWFKPPFPDEDDIRLDVLARLLAGGEETRLYRRLVLREKIAAAINIYAGFPGERFTNMFFVSAVPILSADQIGDEKALREAYTKIESSILDEIEKIASSGVKQEEVDRVKKGLATELVQGFRSNANLADSLTYYETLTGDYRDTFLIFEKLQDIDAAAVQAVAKKYLDANVRMTARLLPPETSGNSEGGSDHGPH